ncbi:MAG: SRPBCC family protein [Pirellulaceae bacterium]|nr:SRPBCC family protein [Pirellulaceae bacterium]
MHHGSVAEIMPANGAEVFDLLHDYDRRLTWDTLLSAAYLDDGFTQAGQGATSVCVGRRSLGSIALKTVYVSFDRPRMAAVKMVNSPPFFGTWAASIRHEDVGPNSSWLTYTWSFAARPSWRAWFLEPGMGRIFVWETQKRLRALRSFLKHQTKTPTTKPM